METVIKSFAGMMFMILLASLGIGLIGSGICAKNADSFLSYVIDRVENSDYAASVINECSALAADRGYSLDMQIYGSTEKYGEAELTYSYNIPIIGINEEHTITGAMC